MDGDTRVATNPMNLLRGAEYDRYFQVTQRRALTSYDLVRSAHDFTTWLVSDSDFDLPEGKLMIKAWREQHKESRIKLAESALQIKPNYPSALIILAEEKASSVIEAEKYFLRAFEGSGYQNFHLSFAQKSIIEDFERLFLVKQIWI